MNMKHNNHDHRTPDNVMKSDTIANKTIKIFPLSRSTKLEKSQEGFIWLRGF